MEIDKIDEGAELDLTAEYLNVDSIGCLGNDELQRFENLFEILNLDINDVKELQKFYDFSGESYEFVYKGFRFRLPKKDFDVLERLPDLLRILPLSKDEIRQEMNKMDEEEKRKLSLRFSGGTSRGNYLNRGDEDACTGDYYWNID